MRACRGPCLALGLLQAGILRAARRAWPWVAAAALVWFGHLAGTARAATYAEAVSADNPIAYWRLDEAGGSSPDVATNSGSLSASGNGVYLGAPLRQQPGTLAGSADPAVAFDGLVQKLDVPYQAALNPSGRLTVELWVRLGGSLGTIRSPLSSRHLPAGGAYGYVFYTTLGNQWEFRTHTGLAASRVLGGVVQSNAWTHLVGVYDGVATRLYVNGVAVGYPVTNAFAANTVTPLRIGGGANEGSGAFFWPGRIDEVAIYNTALSPARVAAHHQAGTNAAPATPYEQVVLADGPVGYWRLNEPAAPPLAVATNRGTLGSLANGTYQAGTAPGDAGPRPPQFIGFEADNRACAFDGTNGFVSTAAGLLNKRSTFTLTGWIKRAGPQGLRAGLFGQNDAVEFGYAHDTTLLCVDFGAATNVTATNAIPDGQWHHVAVVRNASRLALYTNAALAAVADLFTTGVASNGSRFNLGGAVLDAAAGCFRGSLDEVAVFDRALTLEQLAGHYFSAVAGPPRVVVNPPAATNIYAGDTLLLSVAAVGGAPLQFQWQWNSATLPGQTNEELSIPNISPAGAGSYRCRVSNSYGAVTSGVCVVSVLPAIPPSIVSPPQPVTTYAGLTAAFTVTAVGPQLAYQWQANRVNLPGATNRSLVLSNVQPAQAASYRVLVSNGLGTATSAEAALTVLALAPGSFAAAVVAQRPLAYWRLNETSGATAFDYAGHYDAGKVGSVAFGAAGPAPPTLSGFEGGNRAAGFNGLDAYLDASNGLLNARSNFTLLGWLNRVSEQPDTTGLWGQQDVVVFGFIDETTLDVWSPRGGQADVPWPFPVGEWHFAVVVGNGADLRLYLDGALAGVGGMATGDYGSSASGFHVGGGSLFDPLDNNFHGLLDEVAVFDRALTAAEICGLWGAALQTPLRLQVARGPTTPPALRLTWPCGTLQQADALGFDGLPNNWRDVAGALSPHQVVADQAMKFFRVRE